MANLKSWDSIANDPTYQGLPDSEKLKVQQRYQAAGGTTEEAGALTQVGQALQAGAASAAKGINQGVAGLGRMTGLMSEDQANAYEKNIESTYKQNVKGLDTRGAQLGAEYGQTVADIGLSVAAPEIAIPMIAARETGRNYEEQKPGERSAWKAGLVGGANLVANAVLPGVGGKVVSKYAAPAVTEAATQLVNKALGETVGKAVTSTTGKVASNALIGGAGGGAVGAAEAYSKGEDVTQGAIEGAKSGAEFGGAIGTIHAVPSAVKAVNGLADRTFTRTIEEHPGLSDTVKQKASQEHASIIDAATPAEKAQAYANSPTARELRGQQILNARKVPVNDRIAKGNETAQEAFGVSKEAAEAGATQTNAKQDAARATDFKDFQDSMKSRNSSVNEALNTYQKHLKTAQKGSDIEKPVITETNQQINDFKQLNKTFNDQLSRGEYDLAKTTSIQLQDAFDSLHPEIKAHINNNIAEVKGFTKDYSPIDTVHEVETYKDQMNRMSPEAKPDTPILDAASDIGAFGITVGKVRAGYEGIRGLQAKRAQERAAQRYSSLDTELANEPATAAQKRMLSDHPDVETLTRGEAAKELQRRANPEPETPQPTGTRVTEEQLKRTGEIRAQRDQEHLEKVRAKISDPELKKEVTLNNMRDQEAMKTLRKRDQIANVDRAKEGAELLSQAKQQRQDIAHQESMSEVDRWAKEEAPYIDYKKYIRPAIEKAQKQTPKGARLPSSVQVKSAALKAWAKENGGKVTGSKAEFQHTLNTMSADVKARSQPIIDKLYANGAKPTPEQLKKAYATIHGFEAQAHETAGNTKAAEAARAAGKAKGDLVDNMVMTNQSDSLHSAMKQAIKEANDKLPPEQRRISDEEADELITHHIEQTFKKNGNKPLTQVNFDNMKSELSNLAKDSANTYHGKTQVETEEAFTGETEKTKAAREKFDQTGKIDEETKQTIQDHMIHEAEKAFKEGDVEGMKKHANSVIAHYFRKDSARLHTTKRYIELVANAQKMKKQFPNNPELWLTSTEVKSLAKFGNTAAGGQMSKLVDMVQGTHYKPESMLTDTGRAAAIEKLKAKGRSGALGDQPKPKGKGKPKRLNARGKK